MCEEALIRRNEVRLKWLANTTKQLNRVRYTTKKMEAHK
jgi:hypothetical protein